MEANALHDLTAAYALDALDSEDARAYEAHLARCERCREELAELSDAAGALAYGRRRRCLRRSCGPASCSRRQRAPERRASSSALGQARRGDRRSRCLHGDRPRHLGRHALEQARSQRIPARAAGAGGADRRPARISGRFPSRAEPLSWRRTARRRSCSDNLAPAGNGRTYEAWIAAEGAPEPAGLFEGGGAVAIPLDRPVPKGATVMVTKEPAGGRKSPSSQPFVIVRNAAQS